MKYTEAAGRVELAIQINRSGCGDFERSPDSNHMKYYAYFVVAMIWFLAGCSRPAFDVKENASTPSQSAEQHATSTTAPDTLVVNSFGMKFVRVEIEPARNTNVSAPIPNETYYIQQTEVTREHLDELYKFAKNNKIAPNVGLDNVFTQAWDLFSEWRDIRNMAMLMSECDPKYDYGLPSRSQWTFACMSGYAQSCDEKRSNTFGIVDMLDEDFEVIDELGALMGQLSTFNAKTGKPEPSCRCEHVEYCDPDADDGKNEVIVGRFILLPEGTVVRRTAYCGLVCSWLHGKSISVNELERQLGSSGIANRQQVESFGLGSKQWRRFKEQMQPDDQLYEFRSPPETWANMAGRAGIALVRHGGVIDSMVTTLNESPVTKP